MTRSPRRAPLRFETIEEVASAVRERGGRLSTARRILLHALFAAEGPVSAEYLAGGLGGRMIRSEVTAVYRNLERFEEMGVVRHVHLGHGPGLYTLEGRGQEEYLMCERCNRVDAVNRDRLDGVRKDLRDEFGYEASFSHFPIVGLCASCAKEDETPGPPPAHAHEHSHDEHDDARSGKGHNHAHSHGDYVHAHPHRARSQPKRPRRRGKDQHG